MVTGEYTDAKGNDMTWVKSIFFLIFFAGGNFLEL
jgi:hypothetical protein